MASLGLFEAGKDVIRDDSPNVILTFVWGYAVFHTNYRKDVTLLCMRLKLCNEASSEVLVKGKLASTLVIRGDMETSLKVNLGF